MNIKVDGGRPAVEWVSTIPREWTTQGERMVLLALALDSYDGKVCAPGWDSLTALTGMFESSVRECVIRLEKPTEKRPALIRRESPKGGKRTIFHLLTEVEPHGHADPTATPTPRRGRPHGNPTATPTPPFIPTTTTSVVKSCTKPQKEELESFQTDESQVVTTHLNPIHRGHLNDLIPGFRDEDEVQWQDVLHLTSSVQQRVPPSLSIIDFFVHCKRRKIKPTTDGFTQWYRRAEQIARADEETAKAGAQQATAQTKDNWWERGMAL